MNSINIQARVDICTLATLARAYSASGALIKSKSDLIWKATEHLVSMYTDNGVERFTDVNEAMAYLDRIGLYLDSSKRTKRQVQTAQVNQNAISDFDVQSFGTRITKRQLIKEEMSDREKYDAVANFQKSMGRVPITFEQYMKNESSVPIKETTKVVSTIDPVEYAAKEAARLAAEKAAYTPEALRSAMVNKLP